MTPDRYTTHALYSRRAVLEPLGAFKDGFDRAIELPYERAIELRDDLYATGYATTEADADRAYLLGVADACDELYEGHCDGMAAARTTDWDYGRE
jgi:hypothetical protein